VTFLNPWALLGLVAAAIPLVLHLLNLRRLRTVEFSTLRFLKDLQKTSIQRLKLRQILLLIVRTLLIISLVMAFSRPTLQGSIPFFLSEKAKTTAVILFDDSYSMQASDEYGVYIAQAKKAAHTILSSLNEGDEIALLRLSECNAPQLTAQLQHTFPAVTSAIDNIEPVASFVPFSAALPKTIDIFSTSHNYNRELYLLSDFQEGLIKELSSSISNLPRFPEHTQFYFFPIGKKPTRNASLEAISISTVIFSPNKPYTVSATVVNTGTTPLVNQSISIYQNGKRAAEKSVDVGESQRREVDFSLLPLQRGTITGEIILEDDNCEFDNKRTFAITIPEQIHVCIIGTPSETQYLYAALSTSLGDSLTAFRIVRCTLEQLSTARLNASDVLVLATDQEITPERASMLGAFLKRGGGVILFPPEDPNSFNSLFAMPNNTTVFGAIENIQPANLPGEFSFIDFRHPIFSDMFEFKTPGAKKEEQRITLEAPSLNRFITLLPKPQTQIVVRLPNGKPFLTDDVFGRGHLLTVAVNPTTKWSDFPLRALFVPFIHRAVLYSSQMIAAPLFGVCGEPMTIPLPPSLNVSKVTVIPPDGSQISVPLQWTGDQYIVQYSQTIIPGIYYLKNISTTLRAFAINLDSREGTPPLPQSEIENIFNQIVKSSSDIHFLSQNTPIESSIAQGRYGTELWLYFLILAILCAFAEIILARNKNSDDSQRQS